MSVEAATILAEGLENGLLLIGVGLLCIGGALWGMTFFR